MSMKWESKILLAKVEATYGTDATPTGAADAILATNVRLSPMEGQDVDRNLELPWTGDHRTIPAEKHMKLAFNVEMTPSGTEGVAPVWGGLMKGCGVAETIVADTSVTYNPISSGQSSVTLYLWIDSTLYKLRGSRGTCVFRVNAQGIVYLEFEFTGLWTKPSETARATPTLTAQLEAKPLLATTANTPVFTIDDVSLVMRSFSLNFGNQVENRFLIGAEAIRITDNPAMIETTVEAVPLTTLDPFGLAEEMEEVEVVLTHGTTAGLITTLEVQAAQMQRLTSIANQQKVKEWPLRLAAQPVTGNDQWTLTLT